MVEVTFLFVSYSRFPTRRVRSCKNKMASVQKQNIHSDRQIWQWKMNLGWGCKFVLENGEDFPLPCGLSDKGMLKPLQLWPWRNGGWCGLRQFVGTPNLQLACCMLQRLKVLVRYPRRCFQRSFIFTYFYHPWTKSSNLIDMFQMGWFNHQLPSRELTYPIPKILLKMMFRLSKGGIC